MKKISRVRQLELDYQAATAVLNAQKRRADLVWEMLKLHPEKDVEAAALAVDLFLAWEKEASASALKECDRVWGLMHKGQR